MSDTSTIDEPERKVKLESFYFQRKILFGCTIGLFVGLILWIVAISTNRWFIVSGGDGIFVESHRRYFKSSHTGIWRHCRYWIQPQIVSSSVVRNFTTFSTSYDGLKDAKAAIENEEFFKTLQNVDLPDIANITENSEEFRKHLFAEWFDKDKSDFAEMKSKFQSFHKKQKVMNVIYLNPGAHEIVKKRLEGLVFPLQFNKTDTMYVVIPEMLKDALFEGWNDHGMKMLKLLYHYANSLEINPTIQIGDNRFVFQPPFPPKSLKKPVNGFLYHKNQKCTYYNLFADEAEIAADPAVDEDMLDLSRTAATFSIIALFIMVLGVFFTVYTFLNPRYMFKRLAGGVHFISGICCVSVCRALHASVQHAEEHLKFAFPGDATYTTGYGFFFGCLVAAINLISCITFFWYSKKKKGDKAATEELGMADENIQIGR
ncbi:uncharacterized protein [Chironomus tepperi]|uniref:uncharacterized protein n=1 Tax=Chironomus tepperi TaxID=113505 RepID=UPI00391EE712